MERAFAVNVSIMGQQKYNFHEGKVLQNSKLTAVNTMKDQRSLYLYNSLSCLTLVPNCAQAIETYIPLNQHSEFSLEITCLDKDK